MNSAPLPAPVCARGLLGSRGRGAAVCALLLAGLLAGCASETANGLLGDRPEIDALFAEYDRPDSPGCALGVVREGEFDYRAGYGMANLEHSVPNAPDTVFRVGSVSKQFVGMLVLLLEEEGLLSREDDVRRWLPELPDFGDPILVSHLLHHTSGMRDYLVLMSLAGFRDEDYYTAPELLAVLERQRELNFRPGAEHLYSNTGYFLLGQIIERASGQSVDEAARERIFGPLGMGSTHFHDDARRLVPGRASGYARGPEGDWRVSMTTLPIVGDGAVFTSVDDLLAWDRNFYDNRLGDGDPGLVEAWLRPGTLADGTSAGYGAGIVERRYRGLRVVSHGGAFVGFRADMMRFPDQQLTVITLCNAASAEPTRLARQVAEVYLGDLMEVAPSPPDEETGPAADDAADEILLPLADLRGYVGRFVSPELQVTYLLAVEDGRLWWRIPGRLESTLLPEGEDRFRGEELPAVFRFARNSAGEVSGFLLDAGRVRNLWFERVE